MELRNSFIEDHYDESHPRLEATF